MTDESLRQALAPTERLLGVVLEALPSLLTAGLVLAVGMALAMALRALTLTVARRLGLDALAERFGVARLLYALQVRGGLASVLANLVAAITALVTVMTTAEIVGLPGIAEGIGAIVEFLPRLVTAGTIALFGFGAADFVARLAEGIGRRRTDLLSPKLAASLAYYLVLTVILTTAVRHVGLETDLVDLLVGILTAGVVFGFALSFALGSRAMMTDVLFSPYARTHVAVGDRLVVAGVSGVVLGFSTVAVSLRGADGAVHVVPMRRLSEEGFTVLPEP